MPTQPDVQVTYTKFSFLCQQLLKLLNFEVLSVYSTFLFSDSLKCLTLVLIKLQSLSLCAKRKLFRKTLTPQNTVMFIKEATFMTG